MTPLDKLLVWATRLMWTLLSRRMSEKHGRVFWVRATATRPRRLRSGTLLPKNTLVTFGFGGPGAEGNVGVIYMTPEQFDKLRAQAGEARAEQDRLYLVLEGPTP